VLKASKESASESVEVEGYEGRFEKLDGGYTVAFETYTQDADLAPLLKGLPNDQCQAAHWGYVIKGRVTYHFGDRDETFEEGEAYYVPPGHTPELFKGAEVVEFSPTDELQRTIEVAMKNAESAS
jgi:mannose-6-phosphate isomerase-like protein (cupin superfamily)